MMQNSDSDTKMLPVSPSHVKTQNRASAPKSSKKLSEAPRNKRHQIYNSEEVYSREIYDSKKTSISENSEIDSSILAKDKFTSESNSQQSQQIEEDGNSSSKSMSVGNPPKNPKNEAIEVGKSDTNGKIPSQEVQEGFLPVLKNPNFLALWGGQVFCQLADKVYLVLMIALIHTQFQPRVQAISGWVSALMIAFTIPAVLFGSVAGVFVDRWSKKTVLVATNICRGMLVLIIPLLLWLTQNLPTVGVLPMGFVIMLVVTFLVSTLTQFFAPAEQAAIPLVVKPQHLLSANSLYTTTMMASVIIGFAIGEPLLAAADSLWLQLGGSNGFGKELVVGGSYAIAGLILLLLVTHEKQHTQPTEAPHVFADLRDGLGYLKANHRVRNALIQLIILFSIFAALTVLAVRMAEIIPSLKPEQFGFLLAAGGVGMGIGATILGQFGQRCSYRQLSLWGCMGMAVSLIGFALFSQQLWIVLVLITVLGIFGSLVGIPMQTAIQTETPPQMRGKVFGLQNNVINIALTLPLALAGIAENFIGLQAVFLVLAGTVFLGGLLTWYNSQD
ncbi:MAG: MFS transporter [Nostocaceae cyanobacterium]|nr:MFS transporter [Nostocaceae cyanobacterium]